MPNSCISKRPFRRNAAVRTRSASPGRDKESDLRARYWAFLFEILQHAIYQLYFTCEEDENVSECEEVILVLENYTREFYELAKWFRMKCEYDNAPPSQRPTSLAWGVSKSSPGKIFRKSCQPKYDSTACRELIFELDAADKNSIQTSSVLPVHMKLNLDRINDVNEETSENGANNNYLLQQSDLKMKSMKPRGIDCSCQTDESSSTVKRNVPTVRKIISSTPSYTRKCARTPSISNGTVSSVTSKRASPCASPRKPVPGRNIAAPVFVPGKKLNASFRSTESKLNIDSTCKLKITRSQSDSVFETNNSSFKSQHEKNFVSSECVKCEKGDLESKSQLTGSMDVIAENKVYERTSEVVKQDRVEQVEMTNKPAPIVENSIPENLHLQEKNAEVDLTKTVNTSAVLLKKINEVPPLPLHEIEISSKHETEADLSAVGQPVVEPTINSAFASKSRAEKKQTALKVDARNLPIKSNVTSRLNNPRWVAKSPNVPRQVKSFPCSSASRISNPNYVRNVGVPKGSNSCKNVKRTVTERAVPVQGSSMVESAEEKLPKPITLSSYLTATKSNSKEFNDSRQNNITEPKGHHPNIVRSKTSIDMKSVPQVTVKVTSKTCSEERELTPRRRSSKDIDGWETVISRSRRSIPNSVSLKDKIKAFDVNKRFYEPSPSTSLPTLRTVTGKERSPDCTKSEKLKTRNRNNSHGSSNSHVGSDKNDDSKNIIDNYALSNERPILSNTAMFTTIPSRRKKTSEKNSRKGKLKGNGSKLNKEMDNELTADLLNEESMRENKELFEEMKSLQEKINNLKNEEEFDGDSDSTEVDSEPTESGKEYLVGERRALLEAKYSHVLSKLTWAEQVEAMDKLEKLMLERDPNGKSLKYAKRITTLKQFEDFMMRWPGRALQLHQKLSSPSRKRFSPDSTILQQTARQAKAKQKREQLLQDQLTKIKEIFNKIAGVRAMQALQAEERRKSFDQKQIRAEKNRNLHLKNIQQKAHDEAKKQKEIAFINELEAQNKRHNLNAQRQEQEDRLQNILEERQRRREEEKAAKEAAVEERRKAKEAERQEKIEELQEKMRKREERLREFQLKETERLKMVREKARDREDRKLAVQTAKIANAEELQKRIQQKQESSARRYEESIELIRQRAIVIGTPRLTPYQINKLCSICNVVIDSEVFLLSHLRGANHQVAVKKYREQFEAGVKFSERSIITDAPADILQEKKSKEKERQKMLRKRCKKIKQRLIARNEKYTQEMNGQIEPLRKVDTPSKKRIFKSIKEVEKLILSHSDGIWPNNSVSALERNLFEICRVLEKGNESDQQAFSGFNGFAMLSKIYNYALVLPKNMSPYLPLKCFVVASNLYTIACDNHRDNCRYVLLSNNIIQILEFLLNRLNLIMPNSDDRNGTVVFKADTVADMLMNLCSIILSNVTAFSNQAIGETRDSFVDISKHVQDIVSYVVCTGIVDKLAVYCSSVHDDKSTDSFFLLHSIQLLTCLVETRPCNMTLKDDDTSLLATLKATELVGAVSMLYAMLLHQDSISPNPQISITVLQPDVVNVIMATLKFFSTVGELNLQLFQDILGAEGISLQVRHIISYLLKFCVQNETYSDLLHQIIEFVGFFAIHHHENQMILQSGSTPTVLHQLLNLPFAYFSNPELSRILFPTLLACCVDNLENRNILEKEMSFQLLEDFSKSPESIDIPLIKLFH